MSTEETLLERGAREERERIVWWIRAGIEGPAQVTTDPKFLEAAAQLADTIEQHPERFVNAPVRSNP